MEKFHLVLHPFRIITEYLKCTRHWVLPAVRLLGHTDSVQLSDGGRGAGLACWDRQLVRVYSQVESRVA